MCVEKQKDPTVSQEIEIKTENFVLEYDQN